MTFGIDESCSCGATFVYSETILSFTHSNLSDEHRRFLDAHEDCRVKTIISNGKELKLFLANAAKPKPLTEDKDNE